MNAGDILSSVPPVVENIFKHLTKRELKEYSQVCDLWQRVAETEINRREDVVWFFQGLHCSLHNKIHSSCRECSLDVTQDIESDLREQLKDLKIKPEFCLTFASNYFINEFEHLFPSFEFQPPSQIKRAKHEDPVRKRAYLKSAIQTALGQYLPEKCRISFCVAPGIIGCRADSLPLEIEEGCGISGILVPHVPGLQIYNFPIDEKKSDISKLVPEDTRVKCLLVFTLAHESSYFNKMIQSCLLREKSQVAVGGAVVDRSETPRGSVVAFCGQSVEAASVIIKPKDKESELEEKLMLFKKTGLLKDRCFAFMFACVARGFFIYREYNLESSIFHKLYPDVPLIGVFGNGEIGVDYLPNVSGEACSNEVLRIGKLARCRKKYLHSYTTIFVLVSIKL